MFPKAFQPVKIFLLIAVTCLITSDNSRAGTTEEIADFIGAGADAFGERASSPYIKVTAKVVSYAVEAGQAGSNGASGQSLASTALTMGSSAIGARIGGVALASVAARLHASPKLILGAYVVGSYGGTKLTQALADYAKDYASNQSAPTKSPAGQSAESLPMASANITGSTYPFEGYWTGADGGSCSSSTRNFTKTTVTTTGDEEEFCSIEKISKRSESEFDLATVCAAESGDGPSQMAVKMSISLTADGKMGITQSNGGGNVFRYKRCDKPAKAIAAEVPQAPAPKPEQTQQDGRIGLICNLTINGQQQKWQISADLRQGLYTARIGNTIVLQRRAAIVDMAIGNFASVSVGQLKFAVDFAYYAFLAVEPNMKAFLKPFSNSNPRFVGQCQQSAFAGL